MLRSKLSAVVVAATLLGCAAHRGTTGTAPPQAFEQGAATPDPAKLDLAVIQSRQSERGLVLTIPGGAFVHHKAEMKASVQPDLVAVTTYLKQHPDRKVLIEGYTDSHGNPAVNRELSLRNGTAVQAFFLKNGIDPERIEVHGRGAENPIASNGTHTGRRQNRRVEILISSRVADETVQRCGPPAALR